jgi:DNA repair protein RecO (recombination protein O)
VNKPTTTASAIGVVLHVRPLRERSRLLDLLTRETGRRTVVGYGSLGQLRPFTLFALHWREHPDLPRLSEADDLQAFTLEGRVLVCGLYLNELALKLFPRDAPVGDTLPALLEAYAALEHGEAPDQVLRRAEWAFLSEIDSGLVALSGQRLDPDARYRYLPDSGLVPSSGSAVGNSVSGRCLQLLAEKHAVPESLAREARDFMRSLIAIHLQGQEILSRLLLARKP